MVEDGNARTDEDRLDVLIAIGEAWKKHPEYRLGQLCMYASNKIQIEPLYIWDSNIIKGLNML